MIIELLRHGLNGFGLLAVIEHMELHPQHILYRTVSHGLRGYGSLGRTVKQPEKIGIIIRQNIVQLDTLLLCQFRKRQGRQQHFLPQVPVICIHSAFLRFPRHLPHAFDIFYARPEKNRTGRFPVCRLLRFIEICVIIALSG